MFKHGSIRKQRGGWQFFGCYAFDTSKVMFAFGLDFDRKDEYDSRSLDISFRFLFLDLFACIVYTQGE